MSTWFVCDSCGAPRDQYARFCSRCGHSTAPNPAANWDSLERTFAKRIVWAIAAFVVLLPLAAVILSYLRD